MLAWYWTQQMVAISSSGNNHYLVTITKNLPCSIENSANRKIQSMLFNRALFLGSTEGCKKTFLSISYQAAIE